MPAAADDATAARPAAKPPVRAVPQIMNAATGAELASQIAEAEGALMQRMQKMFKGDGSAPTRNEG